MKLPVEVGARKIKFNSWYRLLRSNIYFCGRGVGWGGVVGEFRINANLSPPAEAGAGLGLSLAIFKNI